jgi:hypothetical protein
MWPRVRHLLFALLPFDFIRAKFFWSAGTSTNKRTGGLVKIFHHFSNGQLTNLGDRK